MKGGVKLAIIVAAGQLAAWGWGIPAVRGQDKPDAAFGRVAVLGAIEATERAIIGNRLETFLSRHYKLVPRADYAAAEEEAFVTIEDEVCTEANCIRLIQEYLQVERIYIFQMVRQGQLTQLTMALFKGDSRRVEEDICEDCAVIELRDRAERLTLKLVEEDLEEFGALAATTAEPPTAEPKEPFTPGLGILLTSIGLGAVAAFEFSEALNFDDEAKSKADTDPDESRSLEQDRDTAANIAILTGVVGLSLFIWWLAADDPEEPAAASGDWRIRPLLPGDGGHGTWGLAIARRW